MNQKNLYISLFFFFFLIGCSVEQPAPTIMAEQVEPTEMATLPATATERPSATPSTTPSTTPLPTETPTATETATPAPTETPLPTDTPEPTPHPLAKVTGQIVFASLQDNENGEIYLMKPDGSGLQRLTDDEFFDFEPQISPDGQKVVFSSERDGQLQLYVVNLDGTELTRLTNSEGNDRAPWWSPDSTQIVFSSDRNGKPDLFIIDADGSNEQQLTSNDMWDVSPSWSPDGQWIAFSSSPDEEDPNIYLIRPDGTELTRVTLSPSYDGDAVTWSSNSQWLIIPAQRIGNYELYALNLETGQFGAITHTAGNEYSGLLSADGRYLLINAYYENYTGLIIQDLATGETTELTPGTTASYATWLTDPDTSFDATWLAQAILPAETCVYATDENYGFTAETPIPIGNGPQFGGPFDGFNLYTYVRGSTDEAQTWVRGHTFPTNSRDEILDTLIITTENGQSFTLYVSINDYSIPEIPIGMYCDLELP
jgi:TolB protein